MKTLLLPSLLLASTAFALSPIPAPPKAVMQFLNAEGKAITTAAPGSTIRQVMTLTSEAGYAQPFAVRVPVPKNTTYIGNLKTPEGSATTYSLDGKTFSEKPMKTITENGKTVQVPAPINEYRSVKVSFKTIPAGKSTISYDVRVD